MIKLSRRLLHLLTQKIKCGDFFGPSVISVEVNIVTDGVCGPKSTNATRDEKIFRCNAFKEFLRIIKKFARLFADLRVFEDRWVTATQFPRMKERRPVDIFDQIAHRDRYFSRSINAHSEKFGFGRRVATPIDQRSICARLLERQQL